MDRIKHTDINTSKNEVLGGILYLVGTPIGNLSDITTRALKVLNEVDFIAAEDTRNSGKMLSLFNISKPMVSYFEHNKRERGLQIIERLKAGESCALITDAGMPAISDPGEDIVKLCAEENVPVTIIPGPCAVVSALALSGLTTGRFTFEGFISTNNSERRDHLISLKNEKRTMVIYEAPHKLKKTLSDIEKYIGNRKITLCREMTKINEDIIRTTVSDAIKIYNEKEPKGEYVLVLEGASITEDTNYPESISEHVNMYIDAGMTKMDAVKQCAKDRNVAKSVIYKEINVNN